ncbi:hypothetical protein FD754_011537, partial [Muntiacus muntjak]
QVQKWRDKQYKKALVGTALKANPFRGASHVKGIVLEKAGVETKQPDSAIRKSFVLSDGCLNFIEENDEVLVAGFGHKEHAIGDIPRVHFKVIKVANVSVLTLYKKVRRKDQAHTF